MAKLNDNDIKKIFDTIIHKIVKLMKEDLVFRGIENIKLDFNNETQTVKVCLYNDFNSCERIFTKEDIEALFKEIKESD